MSIEDLADQCHKPVSFIVELEENKHKMDNDLCAMLAKALEMTTDYFIGSVRTGICAWPQPKTFNLFEGTS